MTTLNVPPAPMEALAETVPGPDEILRQLGASGPRELYDALVQRPGSNPQLERQLEAVALPNDRAEDLRAGDLFLRIAMGEGHGLLAVLVTGELVDRRTAERRGWQLEGTLPGRYAHVVEGGTRPHERDEDWARRIADRDGYLSPGHAVLRLKGPLPDTPAMPAALPETAEPGEAEEAPLAELTPVDEAELYIDEATDWIRDALDVIKTRSRIAGGERREDKLTNLVFFDRNPERPRRDLVSGEPGYADLSWQWLKIRDTIVRPALRPARLAAPRYDRDGAIAYARKFWLRPCDDQFIGLGSSSGKTFVAVDPGTRFEHDSDPDAPEHAVVPGGSPIPWTDLDDCTHFISCCIGERPGERCGGLKITLRQLGAPPTAPYGIVRVSSMVSYLVKAGYAQVVAEKSNDETMISRLSAGDLIAYVRRNTYSHLALLLPGNKIACHTYCRSDQPECTWDNDWYLGRSSHSWTWTFLRIVA